MPAERWKRNTAYVHLTTLAKKHGVKLRWVGGPGWLTKSEASYVARLVHIPRPYNPRQYLTALHELGHILGPFQVREEVDHLSATAYQILSEAGAWAWAVEHIHSDLVDAIQLDDIKRVAGHGFSSHLYVQAFYVHTGVSDP